MTTVQVCGQSDPRRPMFKCVLPTAHFGDSHIFEEESVGVQDDDRMEPGDLPVRAWWSLTAEQDLDGFQPKLAEYGSGDLAAIGHDLATLIKWNDAPDRVKAELGTFFYLRGKIARMATAYEHQRLPSDDTLHDTTVYSMMMRRIRARGVLE